MVSLIKLDNQTFKNKLVKIAARLNVEEIPSGLIDPGCDISEDEGDHVESDEVVDPPARNASTKLYMIFVNNVEFRESLQTYCIHKGVNLKQKLNEKERIRAKFKKGCPWHILGSIDGPIVVVRTSKNTIPGIEEITYIRPAGIAVGITNRVGLAKLSIQGNNLLCGVTDVGLKSIGRGCPTLTELSSWNVSSLCDEGLSEIAHDCHLSEKLDLF
ncbi:hypothetical protein KY290_009222 [Solanum tuberosum]|uniref:Transposase MuDR plant domain-containing protein n=1 Tax=Solanum tuberosum TaxID=4113 RepID=A0ABQ7WC38_SOLTU|nr:hypothetical protein KY290_009222 [Solanum tuberosum]